jgi:phage gpG-like protein
MPRGVGPTSSGKGGVAIDFEPPIEFILKQAGAFRRRLEEFASLWELFKPIMGAYEQEVFSTHAHGAWPELAQSTLRYKTGELMVESGALRASLVDPGQAMHIQGRSAWYGTEVEYAHWHQDGGSIPGRPPQRQLIEDPFPTSTRRELEAATITWINVLARETWGLI